MWCSTRLKSRAFAFLTLYMIVHMSQNLKQLYFQMTQFFLFHQYQSSILKKKNNEELNNIDNWLKHNKLSLNYNKTHYMLVTKQKIPLDFDSDMNEHLDGKQPYLTWIVMHQFCYLQLITFILRFKILSCAYSFLAFDLYELSKCNQS